MSASTRSSRATRSCNASVYAQIPLPPMVAVDITKWELVDNYSAFTGAFSNAEENVRVGLHSKLLPGYKRQLDESVIMASMKANSDTARARIKSSSGFPMTKADFEKIKAAGGPSNPGAAAPASSAGGPPVRQRRPPVRPFPREARGGRAAIQRISRRSFSCWS